MKFTHPVQVYYEDTDAGGVVYHSNYLNFMERCRTEMLRSFGVELDQLANEQDIVFVVRRAELDYLSPARFNDRLLVTAEFTNFRRTSVTAMQQVIREKDQTVLAKGQIVVVTVNLKTMRPTPIPTEILEKLKHAE